jgi:Tfp pilus assembly protein PilX
VALVTTVIVVAVLAVVAVAMMQSTTVDRLSARSVANYTRARLAADAGLAMASAAISTNLTNDTFIVVLNPTNRQLFVGNGVAGGTNFSYAPLFSVVSGVTNAVTKVVTNGIPTFSPSGLTTNFPSWPVPGGLSVSSPPAISWTYLTTTNTAGQVVTNARFAYWVEDLGGRLDLSVVGTNSTAVGRRPTGTNPAEIALWTLFNPGASNDVANAAASALTSARSNILSAATARLVDSSVTTNMLADLAANLRHDTNEPEVIPFGFTYADEGKAKYNLNTNLIAAGVGVLADAINRNLPQFGTRGGAMSPADYLNNIAASIIDYADTNDVPTVDNPDNPTYYGIENIPWPNELFDQIEFRGVSGGAIRFRIKDWVEVWNMGNKPIDAAAKLSLSNNYNLILTFTNTFLGVGFKANVQSATCTDTGQAGPAWLTNRTFTNPAISPNGYAVLEVDQPSSTYLHRDFSVALANPSWFATAPIRAAWAMYADINDSSPNLTHIARWGGVVIQKTPDGRWPRYLAYASRLNVPPATPNKWIFCNNLGYASQSALGAAPNHTGGDPRAQYFLKGSLYDQNYINKYASPGGRNVGRFFVSTYPESEVNPRQYWPDSGHIGIPGDTSIDWGGNPTTYNSSPQTIASGVSNSVAKASNNWVMLRNDTGTYSNVLELGNIYDPLQWSDQSASPVASQPGLWTNLTTGAVADARFGGRNTLRVGRWEFSKFTNTGTSAAQLLDIFAAGTNTTGPVANRPAGRININTAGTNALRALAAGVAYSADQALQPDGTNFVVPVNAVSNFMTAVFNRRTNKPFVSSAELAALSTNASGAGWPASAVFGNTNLAGVTEWNDSAAEEWFAKVYPLTTVRSRNFLVHVVAQALQTNGTTVLSTAKRTFQIYIEPIRAANGLTTNSVPRVLTTWDL